MSETEEVVGLVVAAHRDFGREMVLAAEGIVGPMSGVTSVSIHYNHSLDEATSMVQKAIDDTDRGKGVIVFTDMFGGTPTNVALSMLRKKTVEVVAGVNLPMLIKAHVARRTMGLEELAAFIKDYGARNIIVAGEIFHCSLKETT
ncbi:PTS sugar transporter subunit IIA [bacterium]|nr:MAG: PTS sugar transporter subunit IIA [bacterium]